MAFNNFVHKHCNISSATQCKGVLKAAVEGMKIENRILNLISLRSLDQHFQIPSLSYPTNLKLQLLYVAANWASYTTTPVIGFLVEQFPKQDQTPLQ
jgi:hypothetical protein